MFRTKVFSAVLAATALTMVAPGAAHAGRSLNADPEGDVWKVLEEVDFRTNVDLHVTDVRHRRHAVVVDVTYFQLKKTPDDLAFLMGIQVPGEDDADPTNGDYNTTFTAGPGRRAGEFQVSGPTGTCDGTSHAIDYGANTLSMKIPRYCLDTPRWIQFGAEARVYHDTGSGDITPYYDDARSAEFPVNHPYSERIYRSGIKR